MLRIDVRDLGKGLQEVVIRTYDSSINLGLLDKGERLDLLRELLSASQDLSKDLCKLCG